MNKYKITYQEDKKILKQIIECENELDIKSLPKNLISIKKLSKKKIEFKDELVRSVLNELNLILTSNINFNEALKILKQSRKDENSLAFIDLIYKLVIEQQDINKTFQNIKINKTVMMFFELISKTGEINSNLNALNIILLEDKILKTNFKKKLSYPIFLFISFIFSLGVIFIFVIPKFETLIDKSSSGFATKSLFFTQYLFTNYYEIIAIFIVSFILVLFYVFRLKKQLIDEYIFKIVPFYRYYEIYKFFLMLDIFTKSKYEFHIAFMNSSYLIKNKYLLDKISLCNSLLHKGKSIAFSFDKALVFDEIVINLMNIAQQTNSLETIVSDIKSIYKQKFERSFDIFISTIQPIFLIFMTVLILWIVLGIFVPMWDVSNIISL